MTVCVINIDLVFSLPCCWFRSQLSAWTSQGRKLWTTRTRHSSFGIHSKFVEEEEPDLKSCLAWPLSKHPKRMDWRLLKIDKAELLPSNVAISLHLKWKALLNHPAQGSAYEGPHTHLSWEIKLRLPRVLAAFL